MDERPLIEGAHLSDSDSSFESLPAVRRGGGEMGMTQRGGEMGMKHRGAENGVTQIVGDAESNLTENGGLHKQVTDSEQKVTYTIQEAIDHMGFGRYQVMISVLTGLCWMAESMEMMLLSILGPVLHCEWFITSWEQAFLTTLVMLGMAMSSSFWGTMCDKYGRKAILLFGSILAGYFGLLTAVSPMYIWICINRFLVGLAIGICPQSLTLYSEFLPTKSRALCMVCVEVFFAFGTAFEVVIAKLIMPTLGWRYLLGATAIPILLFPCLGYWLPESARYYLACGQRDKAQAVLNSISKGNRAQLPPGELGSLDHTVEKRGEIKDLFAKKYRAVSIILFASWFSVGFCYFGIALLVPTLFTNPDGCHGSDVSTSDKDECHVECVAFTQEDYDELVITGFADFPGLLFIVAVMTCLGRRHSVALCSLLFTIFLLLSNLCVNRITLTFFLFTARAVITGVYQGIYVYTSEVYPTHIRSLGMGFGSGLSRIGALLTPYLAQVGTEKNAYIGINGYVLFGIITICLVLALPIETKGRSMQDTEEYTELDN